MLLSLTKPVEGRDRRVVVVCDDQELSDVGYMAGSVLGNAKPVRKRGSDGTWKYYFHLSYLDDLLLAFPTAIKSAGLTRRLNRLQEVDYAHREVDPFPIPDHYDYINDCPAKPFDYQYMAIADCVRFMLGEMDGQIDEWDFVEGFLENDAMGLGKTFILLATIKMLMHLTDNPNLKFLVITPRGGKMVWEFQNRKWFGDTMQLEYVDAQKHTPSERERIIESRPTITVINPEMVRGSMEPDPNDAFSPMIFVPKYPSLFNFHYDYCIIDEYHRFGNPDSQMSMGFRRIDAGRFLPASGTPFLNRPTQLWVVLNRVWPEKFTDYESFVKSLQVKDHNGRVVGYSPKRSRKTVEFMRERSIRRRRDQVLKDLPPVVPFNLPVEMTREQRRIYNQIRDELLIELDSGEKRPITFLRTQIMRLRQACFSPELFDGSAHSGKIDELKESVASMVESGEKVLIGAPWKKACRIMERELAQYNPAYVDGSVTSLAKRAEQARRFNEDPNCHLYIGTIQANREAITLNAATQVIMAAKEWSPQENQQFVDRSASGGLRGLGASVSHIALTSLIAQDSYESLEAEGMLDFKDGTFRAWVETDGGRKMEPIKIESLADVLRHNL